MDLKELLSADLSKAAEEAKQAAGNTLFSFLGTSLQKKAEDGGIELKSAFVPNAEKSDVAESVGGFVMDNQMLLLGGAAALGLFLIFKSK
jgi:hypothetical protein